MTHILTFTQGGLYPLVAMLKSKAKDVQRNAAKIIAVLATEKGIRVSVVDEGAISPLLDMLVDPVAENSMAACKALLHIAMCVLPPGAAARASRVCRYVEARSKIVAEGAMPRFVKLLGTQSLEDELLLLNTCAMLSQVRAPSPACFIAPTTRRSTPRTTSRWCATASSPASSPCCARL